MMPSGLSTDDDAFLNEVFELALRQCATGDGTDLLDAFVARRPYLRSESLLAIDLAKEVAVVEAPAKKETYAPVVSGFTILEEVGRGGLGVVYRARQDRLGRTVALKFLAPSLAGSARSRERFVAEARALGRIRHPNVVTVHEVLTDDHLCGYAMEWVDGTTLARAIASKDPRLDVATVARMGIDVARALSAVHAAGMIHRDVKPGNILLRRDGTPLLSDFSVVRDADQSQHTATGDFLGTAAFAAPEQLRGRHSEVGPWTDVYALGVTLYSALTSEAPFGNSSTAEMLRRIENGLAKPVGKVNRRVPRDLETVIAKAMDPDPARRYQTAAALAEDLDRFLRFEAVGARRTSAWTRFLRLARRNRSAFVAAIGAAMLVVALAIGIGISWKRRIELPGRFREALRSARAHLLDPDLNQRFFIAMNIPGAEAVALPLPPVDVIGRALDGYQSAMELIPGEQTAVLEHAVVAVARAIIANDRVLPSAAEGLREACPATWQAAQSWVEAGRPNAVDSAVLDRMSLVDRRHLGLLAFLCTQVPLCVKSWEVLDGDPDYDDPLVSGALGEAWLVMDRPALAVPRLGRARQEFPECGFLTVDLADALVRTGDLVRAEAMLSVAQRLRVAGSESVRVEADLCLARGEKERARALYLGVTPRGPTGSFHIARFLAGEGELHRALDFASVVCSPMPGVRRYRDLVCDIVGPAWVRLSPDQQAEVIAAAAAGRHGHAPIYAIGCVLRDRGLEEPASSSESSERGVAIRALWVVPEVMHLLRNPAWRSRPALSRAVARLALHLDAMRGEPTLARVVAVAVRASTRHVSGGADPSPWERRTDRPSELVGRISPDLAGPGVAEIGDVDGDGSRDVVVADPRAKGGKGSVHVVSGRDGRVMHACAPDHEGPLGPCVAAGGDFDRDGAPDVLIGSAGAVVVCSAGNGRVIRTIVGRAGEDGFGRALSPAGDIDRDGRSDVIVGAPWAGYALVFSGSTGAVLHALEGPPGASFGAAVDGGRDADGDGVPDLLVGGPTYQVAPLWETGSVWLYSGATGRLLWNEAGHASYALLGTSVALLPDSNGDGFAEWAAGAPEDRCGWLSLGSGHVMIFAGPRGEFVRSVGGQGARWGGYGRRLAVAGGDLLVAADYTSTEAPLAYADLLSRGSGFQLGSRLPALPPTDRLSTTSGGPGEPPSLLIGTAAPPGFARIPLIPAPR